MIKEKGIHQFNKTIIYLVFLLISVFVIYPLVYVVSGAFAPGNSIASLNIVPFKDGVTFEHFIELFTKNQFGTWFLNTLIIALETCAATVVISVLVLRSINVPISRGANSDRISAAIVEISASALRPFNPQSISREAINVPNAMIATRNATTIAIAGAPPTEPIAMPEAASLRAESEQRTPVNRRRQTPLKPPRPPIVRRAIARSRAVNSPSFIR